MANALRWGIVMSLKGALLAVSAIMIASILFAQPPKKHQYTHVTFHSAEEFESHILALSGSGATPTTALNSPTFMPTPTALSSATATPIPTETSTETATPSPTESPSPTGTPSMTPTPSMSPTPSVSPSYVGLVITGISGSVPFNTESTVTVQFNENPSLFGFQSYVCTFTYNPPSGAATVRTSSGTVAAGETKLPCIYPANMVEFQTRLKLSVTFEGVKTIVSNFDVVTFGTTAFMTNVAVSVPDTVPNVASNTQFLSDFTQFLEDFTDAPGQFAITGVQGQNSRRRLLQACPGAATIQVNVLPGPVSPQLIQLRLNSPDFATALMADVQYSGQQITCASVVNPPLPQQNADGLGIGLGVGLGMFFLATVTAGFIIRKRTQGKKEKDPVPSQV
mmetsp:Transcript_36732/g.59347  ORF Transcript_36732/g.59347 Transcript_36732/m.59347 type:complete len:394 (-) Transcript_36732:387-1568(-)|eukprot:CAMPEP_0184657336 /NCGR_PEP_ID=MMETSP0308-20130426/19016_1 /TAXON_ID=38269 /ORGANISM="Gloeochaete witrockiana, Strain SAG 46.84" /LENGTH=393 /DNA_ID=CAMNT_0027095065 /DNA_START=336 /DNA_END=1517 /DNA_ORIENTATION=+